MAVRVALLTLPAVVVLSACASTNETDLAQVSASSAANACSARAGRSGDLDWTIRSGDRDRTVHVHVPPSYDPAHRIPVVLNFHGYGRNGVELAQYSGMSAKADAAGFVVVHPEGTGSPQAWNAGEHFDNGVDDVAFVRAILDRLETELCVDAQRVFSTGISNGAFLSHRLACELSDRIAAIAPVAGLVDVPCTPSRAVPVMQFHGTADSIIPWKGVPAHGFPGVEEMVAGWAMRDGCSEDRHTSFAQDEVRCDTQSACAEGSEVTLCTIGGGGHTWPGAQDVPELGMTTHAIRATDAMWAFFQRHPL